MPEHPIGQLTTAELRQYKRDLQRSLKGLPAGAPVREDLRAKLELIREEEASRASIARANGAP